MKKGVYTHIKTGNLYRVLLCATNANNNESDRETEMVVYQSLASGLYFVRDTEEFSTKFTYAGE